MKLLNKLSLKKNRNSNNKYRNFFHDKINALKKIYKKNIVKNRTIFNIKEVVFVMLITFLFV